MYKAKSQKKVVKFLNFFRCMGLYFSLKYGIIRGASAIKRQLTHKSFQKDRANMKLNYDRNSKDPTYFIQKGYRYGKKTTTKNIVRIGKHSELLKMTDDPLAYAKEQVEKYNEAERMNNRLTMEITVDFEKKIRNENELVSQSTSRNIGYFFLQQIYQKLDLRSFFKKITENSKITYDPNQINRFMTFSRILEPDSKLGSFQHLNCYYEEPEFNYVNILRTMDIMQEHYDEYICHLFEKSSDIVKRDTSVCYYDCTNYYFEIESPDEDYVDEVTGEFVKGFRKYGISKQHQPAPLVEMGLFMDADGIPLTMCVTSGSDNEQTTAIPIEKKLIQMLKGKKFIYCADAGIGSVDIRNFNSMGGRAFIITQSIRQLPDKLKKAVFNDIDYKLLSSDNSVTIEEMKSFDKTNPKNKNLYKDKAYKIINADKDYDAGFYEEKILKNGTKKLVKSKTIIPQKIIITFSRKAMEYQQYIRNRQIERATALLKNMDPETYKKGPSDITRFIKRTSSVTSGEKVNDRYEIDWNKIEEDAKYDGYYAVATNLDDDVHDILAISSQRYKIEDCFRIMKTNFSARPVYHQRKDRIIAHFMICYTALLIYRLLEKKLNQKGVYFSVENIIETLRNMDVVNVEDMYFMSTYTGSQVCTALNEVFELELDKKYYLPKELNRKLKKIL